jgi:tetratricopeptide (TPR) repeat protein
LPIAQRNGYTNEEKIILNALAVSYAFTANYDKALDYNFKSLEILEREGDLKQLSRTLNNTELIYYKLGNFEKALHHYTRSLSAKQESKDSLELDLLLINIALCYNRLKDYMKAEQYVYNAFKICSNDCSSNIRMQGEFCLGLTSFELRDFKNSRHHFIQALDQAKVIIDQRYEADIFVYLGKIEIEEQKYKSAQNWLLKAVDLAKKLGIMKYLFIAIMNCPSSTAKEAILNQLIYFKRDI